MVFYFIEFTKPNGDKKRTRGFLTEQMLMHLYKQKPPLQDGVKATLMQKDMRVIDGVVRQVDEWVVEELN